MLALGVDVDTVLSQPHVTPGGDLTGEVRFKGGPVDHEVQGITLVLVGGQQRRGTGTRWDDLQRVAVTGPFVLPAGTVHAVPFRLTVPWGAPLTKIGDKSVTDLVVRVRTELALAGALDQTDSDPVTVRPLPAQQRVLETLDAVGYAYDGAKLVRGTPPGGTTPGGTPPDSDVPVWQQLAFRPTRRGRYPLLVTFLAGPTSLELVLDTGKVRTEAGLSVSADVPEVVLDIVTGNFAPTNYVSGEVTGDERPDRSNRSTVEYEWLDEDLDWEGWIKARVFAVAGW